MESPELVPQAVVSTDPTKEFFDKNQDFFEHYAADSSLEIKPSPEGLGTFAIDLEKGVMYAEPKFFTEAGYTSDKAMFATLHEFEHFREMSELLTAKDGAKIWQTHQRKREAKRRFNILDNCFDDIKMNRAVINRAPTLVASRQNLYQENLFPEKDLSKLPKHLQFSYALLRERMLAEQSVVASDVRAELERLETVANNGVKLLDYASDPNTSMATRLKLQELFLEPVMEKFFQEDVEQKKEAEKKQKSETENGEEDGKDEGQEGESKPKNSEDYFKEEYEEYTKRNPEPISETEVAEAVKKFIESVKNSKTTDQLAEEAYARAEGVTAEDLKNYRRFWQEIEQIKNPETNESVVEEIREIFRQIIAERHRPRILSKYPTIEGEILAKPAEAVAAVKSGIREPEVWETVEPKERPKELFGDFEVTIVADRSGSMAGVKAVEQRKVTALVLEALKEFSDDLEEEKSDILNDLNVRTEVWSFGGESESVILKALSKELSEKERVAVYQTLADTPGGNTMDFLTLERITAGLNEADAEKILAKKMRKMVIVMTDGNSDSPERVQKILAQMRTKGIIVVGVGVTSDGVTAVTTYAPDGLVCEKVENLARVLGDLLKKEIQSLNEGHWLPDII